MNDAPQTALLPTGLYDLLPPEAEVEAEVIARLTGVLRAHGYQRVKPPMVEFEETLFSGAGAAMANDAFRLMDPISHRMVAVRADMTPQVARIASTRLGHAPRPLRLSYSGQVLRVKGPEMRPERQIGQVGAELIGAEAPAADVEAIAVAGEALTEVGVPFLSVDITLPTLVPAVVASYGIENSRAAALRVALDHKDVAAVAGLAGEAGALLSQLVEAAGPAASARKALDALDLRPAAAEARDRLGEVLDGLAAAMPRLKVTVDPVENRGFEYHTGISFTFFARVDPEHGPIGELGRGGRYQAGSSAAAEPATGFTLYTDAILRTLPEMAGRPRILVPPAEERARAAKLRSIGWATVAALAPAQDWAAEARRLGCGHVLAGGNPVPVASIATKR